MNRNTTYFIIGALTLAVVALGFFQYQDRQKSGVEISVGESGISIEER